MALAFTKIKKQVSSADEDAPTTSKPAQKSGSVLGFLKKGAAAKEALQKEEAQAELRKQEQGRLWRFRMPEGEERKITFLDGDIDDDGMLDINMFYEHTIRVNGTWENFVCTADTDTSQPCPICEAGNTPSLVGVMTVIDHSEHKIKKGPNAGKTITNQRKLFVAKQGTLKLLTKQAVKRGGLAGCTFEVSRLGDKDPAVGNQFDFVHKFESYEEIAEELGLKIEDVQPANYEEEIRYRSPEELIELGVGKALQGPGLSNKGSSGSLKDEL